MIMFDKIIRATAADAQIRAFSASTGNLVEVARKAHDLSPVASAALGRLLTAGAMMGVTLKGEKDILTIQVKGDGPIGGLTVTADSAGRVKGYAYHPQVMLPPSRRGKLDVGGAVGKGWLQVIKDMGLKEPYTGRTDLQTGEIGEDLTYYFATSEQVPSAVGLGVLMERDNTVKCAGGFMIQLMPFAEEKVIARLEQNLAAFSSVTEVLEEYAAQREASDQGKSTVPEGGSTQEGDVVQGEVVHQGRGTDQGKSAVQGEGTGPRETAVLGENTAPEYLLARLLDGINPVVTETVEPLFYCNCDKKRVEKALISIGKKEIAELIEENETVEVKCHFCNKAYHFEVDELKRILVVCL